MSYVRTFFICYTGYKQLILKSTTQPLMTKRHQLYLPSIFDGGIFVDSVFLSASSQLIETHVMNITVLSFLCSEVQ